MSVWLWSLASTTPQRPPCAYFACVCLNLTRNTDTSNQITHVSAWCPMVVCEKKGGHHSWLQHAATTHLVSTGKDGRPAGVSSAVRILKYAFCSEHTHTHTYIHTSGHKGEHLRSHIIQIETAAVTCSRSPTRARLRPSFKPRAVRPLRWTNTSGTEGSW